MAAVTGPPERSGSTIFACETAALEFLALHHSEGRISDDDFEAGRQNIVQSAARKLAMDQLRLGVGMLVQIWYNSYKEALQIIGPALLGAAVAAAALGARRSAFRT